VADREFLRLHRNELLLMIVLLSRILGTIAAIVLVLHQLLTCFGQLSFELADLSLQLLELLVVIISMWCE
jgi:hypothetical protein